VSGGAGTPVWTNLDRQALVIEGQYRRDRWRYFRSAMRGILAEALGIGSGHHRAPRRTRAGLLKPALVLSLVFFVTLSYGGGISYGHWITQVPVDTHMRTGVLSLTTSGLDPGFNFDCETHRFPKHAISFVRLWAPDQEPGDLTSGGSGAVKIEEDGSETADGYSIEPADAAIGDSLTIHLGETDVTIGSWVPKPQDAQEFVGFTFAVDGDPVVVDVKANGDLWRTTLSGSGLWSLDGMPDTDSILITSCRAPSITGTFIIGNDGSIPATADLVLAGPVDNCERFELIVETPAGVLAQGPLCASLNQPFSVAEQLDPGASVPVSLTLTLLDPIESFTMPLALEVEFAQWNGGGWMAADQQQMDVIVSVVAPDPVLTLTESSAENEKEQDTDGSNEEEETSGDVPAEEPPGDETPPGDEPPEGETPPPDSEPPTDPATLDGLVWEDVDGNGATLGTEAAVAGVQVMLFDGQGELITSAVTNETGRYRITDIVPGEYLAEFVATDGFTFLVTSEPTDEEIEVIAEELGVSADALTLSDVTSADGPDGRTELMLLAAGSNDGVADAALVLDDDAAPAEPPEDEQPPSDDPPNGEQPPGDDQPPPSGEKDPKLASLSGYVWVDTDDDHLTVLDGSEPRVEGAEVVLLTLDGVEVGAALTDGQGFYEITGLEPGTYVASVIPPDGLEPSIPPETTAFETLEDLDTYLQGIADLLGVPIEDLILSDITGLDDSLSGLTDPLTLEPGDNPGVADAALIPAPSEEESQTTDDTTVANQDGAAKEQQPPSVPPPTDNNDPDPGSGDDTPTTTTTTSNNPGGDRSNENSDD